MIYTSELLRFLLKTDLKAKINAFDIDLKNAGDEPLYLSLRSEM